MNGCTFGFHEYGRWSVPERANVLSGFSVKWISASAVQYRTCERCGFVDVRELNAEINTSTLKKTKEEE